MKNLVVAGIPRCGTTYLFRCLMGLPPGSGSPKGAHLASLPGIKCHSLAPPEEFRTDPWVADVNACLRHNGGRAIFVYGDPFAAVVSTMQKRFDHVHAANCGCGTPLSEVDLLKADFFNYEKMFDSWMRQKHPYPVLAIRYETMMRHTREIELFVGHKVKWNEWRQRGTKVSDLPMDVYSCLVKVYDRLMSKIYAAPNCRLL